VPRFFIKATVIFPTNNDIKTDVAEVLAIAPGESISDWQTEKAMAISAVRSLFSSANHLKRLTLLMKPPYAFKVFPAKRSISKLTIEIMEMGTSRMIVREFANELSVMRTTSAPDRFLPRDVETPARAVTLKLEGTGGFNEF
jgi:hypothetical protein